MSMNETLTNMHEQFFAGTIAVVGATDKRDRFGFKVFEFLLDNHPEKTVLPINPGCKEVLDVPCFESLQEVLEKIDTVVMIVNPKIGKKIITTVIKKGITKVWFQPGSESDELRDICEKNNIAYSMGACLMQN